MDKSKDDLIKELEELRQELNLLKASYNQDSSETKKARGSFQDITDRGKTELAIRISENKYRRLHESIMDGFIQTTMDGKIEDCNPSFLKMVGYQFEEITKLTYFDLTPEKWHDSENEIRNNQILLNGYSEVYEKEYIRKNGTVFPVELRTFLIKNEEGENEGMWAIIRDITDRKLNQRIYESRFNLVNFSLSHTLDELLEELLDCAEKLTGSEISFVHFVDENQEFLNLQNWSKRTKNEFCTAEGKGSHYPVSQAGVWVDCIYERKPVIHNDYASLPHRKGLPEGHARVVRELVVPVFRGEKITAILGVGNKPTDYLPQDVETLSNIANLGWEIVERMRTEEALRESEELFHKIFDTSPIGMVLVGSKFNFQEANQSFCDFIGFSGQELANLTVIAHDLKSPFNSIVGFSDLLVEQIKVKNFQGIEKYADIILQSSQRAMNLLMNLLEWSRSQTGRMEFMPEYFKLDDLIREVILLFSDISRQKSIRFKADLPSHLIVYADKSMISTVLRNLISNAIKFSWPGGETTVAASEQPGCLLISVADSGTGISEENLNKIFRIDENLSTPGTQNEKGTGLGLVLCREFIEKHGGKIWVQSHEGQGSVFYFSLPLTQ